MADAGRSMADAPAAGAADLLVYDQRRSTSSYHQVDCGLTARGHRYDSANESVLGP